MYNTEEYCITIDSSLLLTRITKFFIIIYDFIKSEIFVWVIYCKIINISMNHTKSVTSKLHKIKKSAHKLNSTNTKRKRFKNMLEKIVRFTENWLGFV